MESAAEYLEHFIKVILWAGKDENENRVIMLFCLDVDTSICVNCSILPAPMLKKPVALAELMLFNT